MSETHPTTLHPPPPHPVFGNDVIVGSSAVLQSCFPFGRRRCIFVSNFNKHSDMKNHAWRHFQPATLQRCKRGHGVSWARWEGTVLERRGAISAACRKAKQGPCSSFPPSCWTDSLLTMCATVWKHIGAEGVELIRLPFTRRLDR